MSDHPTLVWGATHWLALAAAAAVLTAALLAWGYWRTGANLRPGLRVLSASLKAVGLLVLALCLLEPLFSGTRARPGANLFVVLADNSQSMALKDRDQDASRGEQAKALASKGAAGPARLGQDFDVRQHAFDTQLRAMPDFASLTFDGGASNLAAALRRVSHRYQGRPVAGVLLFTDGSATDAQAVEELASRVAGGGANSTSAAANADPNAARPERLPPVYPVLLGGDAPANDLSVESVTVTQTNFEDAPVTLAAQVVASGYAGRTVVASLIDESGKVVQKQNVRVEADGKPAAVRFSVKPEQGGVSFYRVTAAAEDEPAPQQAGAARESPEATLANNTRMAAVDRGRGPYRVLYVSGRPNWEYKFLQRAVASDDQVRLVGLLRIAKREPKFTFLGRRGEETNPLYRGFDPGDKAAAEAAEQYDQPVLVRLNTDDANELRGGFPKTAEELYAYHAVILDDVESEFFTQDQMQLLKEFVRQRGGALLMLGGTESFHGGKYDRTPIGDLLPVYADEAPEPPASGRYRLALTREGWLEPWVRLRPEEDADRKRLAGMPEFHTLNTARGIKPGATVLARVEAEGAPTPLPALVEQRFGQGRVGAMLVGDLWRWGLRKPENAEDDLAKAWRQTVRWLVADVPQRVDVDVKSARDDADGGAVAEGAAGAVVLSVQARDAAYAPLDNASVAVQVTGPDNKPVQLTAEPSSRKAGVYEATYVPRQPGAYRAQVTVSAPDGSEVGKTQTGWTSDPAADEFRDLKPNRALLDRIARATGGQVVAASDLDGFVKSLPTRHADVTEPYVRPVWHQPWVFLLAILCLTAEWGVRRWKGLP
jgi:uncharacterized membrane protein